jgi:mono/diheme cytochrome c family protein
MTTVSTDFSTLYSGARPDLFMKAFAIFGMFLFAAAFVLGESAVSRAEITPVTGESWLHQLGRSFDETSMGKTWQLGPASEVNYGPTRLRTRTVPRSTNPNSRVEIVNGSGLYRINCQGCHGEFGLGAPSEIPSLIDPVRASSAALVGQRMKKLGMELSQRQIAEFANQSRGALLKRLHEGGQDMPSFGYLNELEMRSLVAYLNQLADVPGAEKKANVIRESPVRIGELIVKSTCHTCHAATGANPTPAEMFAGAIPPLSAIPTRVDQAQLVRKVTRGAPVAMESTVSLYRGRMPVFTYLTEDDAANVYAYLAQYPPAESGTFDRVDQTTIAGTSDPPASMTKVRAETMAATPITLSRSPVSGRNYEYFFLLAGVGFFAVVLTSMCWITLHEFRRLSTDGESNRNSQRNLQRRENYPAPWFRVRSAPDWIADGSGPPVETGEQGLTEWVDRRKIS